MIRFDYIRYYALAVVLVLVVHDVQGAQRGDPRVYQDVFCYQQITIPEEDTRTQMFTFAVASDYLYIFTPVGLYRSDLTLTPTIDPSNVSATLSFHISRGFRFDEITTLYPNILHTQYKVMPNMYSTFALPVDSETDLFVIGYDLWTKYNNTVKVEKNYISNHNAMVVVNKTDPYQLEQYKYYFQVYIHNGTNLYQIDGNNNYTFYDRFISYYDKANSTGKPFVIHVRTLTSCQTESGCIDRMWNVITKITTNMDGTFSFDNFTIHLTDDSFTSSVYDVVALKNGFIMDYGGNVSFLYLTSPQEDIISYYRIYFNNDSKSSMTIQAIRSQTVTPQNFVDCNLDADDNVGIFILKWGIPIIIALVLFLNIFTRLTLRNQDPGYKFLLDSKLHLLEINEDYLQKFNQKVMQEKQNPYYDMF